LFSLVVFFGSWSVLCALNLEFNGFARAVHRNEARTSISAVAARDLRGEAAGLPGCWNPGWAEALCAAKAATSVDRRLADRAGRSRDGLIKSGR
jgi:hypothetical protein